MGGNVPGGNFLGGNFPGESLMGGNFPGDSFPDTTSMLNNLLRDINLLTFIFGKVIKS